MPNIRPGLPWVYVGETSKPIDDRIAEHCDDLTGKKGRRLARRTVNQRFVRPRPDLNEHRSPVFHRYDSIDLEKRVKRELAELGYSVTDLRSASKSGGDA